MRTLWIVRGIAGSGKTTLANIMKDGLMVLPMQSNREMEREPLLVSADDYFYAAGRGEYKFDKTKLGEAHRQCQVKVTEAMEVGLRHIIVHNTFSQQWEFEQYKQLAKYYKYAVFIIECQNDFGSTHHVPQETITAMRERWEMLEAEND